MLETNGHTLFLLGSSHQSAPLEVREKIALNRDSMDILYRNYVETPLNECLILNTCNRIEFYGVAQKQDIRPTVESFLCQHHSLKPEMLNRYTFWKTNEDVVNHIFEVTAGLNSQMVGETEILGQVKHSFAEATKRKALGPVLNRVFQKGFQAAKWARTHTGIGRGQVSIGNVATDLATRVCGDLSHTNILTIGTGEVGEKTTQALSSRGAKRITIASRKITNAQALAEKFKGAAITFDDLEEMLHQFDVIITGTASSQTVLSKELIEKVIKKRPTQPLFIIDLAVPRDVETDVASLRNVYLYNVEHLAQIANENLKARMSEMELCRHALKEKATHVWKAIAEREQTEQ